MRRFLLIAAIALPALALGGCDDENTCAPPSSDAVPEIVDFTATPAKLNPGMTTELHWTVKNASAISIDTPRGTLIATNQCSGTVVTGALDATTEIVLSAQHQEHTAERTLTVEVECDEPQIIQFSVPSRPVFIGNTVTVRWSVVSTDVLRLLANGGLVAERMPGTKISDAVDFVVNGESTELVLEASRCGRTARASGIVTGVRVPEIELFRVEPEVYLGLGSTATVTWSAPNATRTELEIYGRHPDAFPGTPEGTYTFALEGPTMVVLTAHSVIQPMVATLSITGPDQELEENDDFGHAQPIEARGVYGEIFSATDVDTYSLYNGDDRRILIKLTAPSGDWCSFDNRLEIFDMGGSPIFATSEGGLPVLEPEGGECAAGYIEARRDTRVLIQVRGERDAIGRYLLSVQGYP